MNEFGSARYRGGACIVRIILVAIATLQVAADARAGTLAQRLTPEVLAIVYPDTGRLGPEEGAPPAIAVYKDDVAVGYIFSTLDVVAAHGYSSVPFDVIAGVTIDGVITGAKVIAHREPDVLNDDTRKLKLDTFLSNHADSTIQGGNAQLLSPSFVAGATFSARSMRGAIYDSARLVLRAHRPRQAVTVPTLNVEGFVKKSWDELRAQGAVVHRRVTNREAAATLEKSGGPGARPDVAFGRGDDDTYIEIFAGLATPNSVGVNLFGNADFAGILAPLAPGTQIVAVASSGVYDFLGKRFDEAVTVFDRIRLVQGDRAIAFIPEQFKRLGINYGRPGILSQQVAALFFLSPQSGFDPLLPWRLEATFHGTDANGKRIAAVTPLDYRLPAALLLMPDIEPTPVWVDAWQESRADIAVLGAALVVLTLILIFQVRLTRSRRTYRWVRNAFLTFVVVWLGWITGGQLSIVNVTNYLLAPIQGVGPGFFLAEPIMMIIAIYTAISLVLLGRGVFCGWLCPFGALQELLGQLSRALGLPQWNPSERLQRRLWLVKYVAAALVLGLAFIDTDMASKASEVEPFKTAITSHFVRAWPFVLYAAGLLAVGLFTERAYCRFLCPLGGTLALLDRVHLVDMLKRRPECGSPCHLCEASCPVKAIERSGRIKMAECFQCLDCQVEYYDDKRCPPLAQANKVRRRGEPVAV